ncbi:MAG: DUF2142 domain-containing protein, partial [Ardenticatenaceae bacterium]
FEYAWLIADLGRLPGEEDIAPRARRELAASMAAHDFYRDLTLPNLLPDDQAIGIGVVELSHPPLYYALVSLPLRLLRHLDMESQLYVARGLSLLLFLLFILASAAIMRELTPPGHPLRWAVPLALTLLPPFVSHMTAVNNDVGAVLAFTLFLWAAVRTLSRGLSPARLLWLVGAALLAAAVKSTSALALLLAPVVVAVALWRQRDWPWRWFWAGSLALLTLAALLLLEWSGAAYWYADEGASGLAPHLRPLAAEGDALLQEALAPVAARGNPPAPTVARVAVADAPDGDHALFLESGEEEAVRLLNPLAPEDVQALRGEPVTLGGWLWAVTPTSHLPAPGLLTSPANSLALDLQTTTMNVSTTPTFFSATYTIPQNAGKAYFAFGGEGE